MSAEGTRPVVERLVRLEAGQDASSVSFTDHEARLRALERDKTPGTYEDHESRLRRLERSWWRLSGAAAAVGGILGSFIGPVIGH